MVNLYNIYESLILESANRSQIIDSINQPYRVKIYYQGENEDHPNWRFIDPYVLGTSLAGNEILRAYQSFGFTTTEGASWKTFRTDRILRWEPTKFRLGKKPIDAYGSNIPPYRLDGGDNLMTSISAYRKFGDTERDQVMRQQVNMFNQTKEKIKPTPTVKPTAKPPIKPVTEPAKPKVQPTAAEPKIKQEPLLPKEQPEINANPEMGAENKKKI